MGCAVLDHKRNALIVFHGSGIYRVSLSDGRCEKIASSQWSCAKAAVNISGEKALVFHSNGLYIVRLVDGSHSIVNGGGNWDCVSCVCPLGSMAWSTCPGDHLGCLLCMRAIRVKLPSNRIASSFGADLSFQRAKLLFFPQSGLGSLLDPSRMYQ